MAQLDRRSETRIEPAVFREQRNRRVITRPRVDDVQFLQVHRAALRFEFRALLQSLLHGFGQVHLHRRDIKALGEVQRDVLPDFRRQVVTQQIRQIIFGDAPAVARLDERRTLVRHRNFRAQHVELRNCARVITVALVFQFLLQQFHRRLAHDDLLGCKLHVVIRQPHRQQCIRHRRLVVGQRLLARGAR